MVRLEQQDALIMEADETFNQVVHASMNYRLGGELDAIRVVFHASGIFLLFGFAQSESLRRDGSENAGLRDQRLAIEWVHDNVRNFGG